MGISLTICPCFTHEVKEALFVYRVVDFKLDDDYFDRFTHGDGRHFCVNYSVSVPRVDLIMIMTLLVEINRAGDGLRLSKELVARLAQFEIPDGDVFKRAVVRMLSIYFYGVVHTVGNTNNPVDGVYIPSQITCYLLGMDKAPIEMNLFVEDDLSDLASVFEDSTSVTLLIMSRNQECVDEGGNRYEECTEYFSLVFYGTKLVVLVRQDVFQLLTFRSAVALIKTTLSEGYSWKQWSVSYRELLPYYRDSLIDHIKNYDPAGQPWIWRPWELLAPARDCSYLK